jgi:arylsulfatase A-like enzyme
MMVGFPGPHCPYDPAADFEDAWKFDPADMPAAAPDAGDTPKLRAGNIDGNKGDWNGVDISDFTDAQKSKVRAHYAGLVKQVDHEVGEVLGALKRNGLLNNTVVILATDHGDYLGDHGLIGKASFYEAAIHIPMVIQGPGLPVGQVSDDLVEVRDITTTMLAAAGMAIPQHMDSRPLPGLGLTDEPARERIYGMLSDGWMIYDGEWRLSRYSTGEVTFYNMHDDPQEQVNLTNDPLHRELRDRLSTELDREIMRSIRLSMHDRLADLGGMAMQAEFGYEGGSRPYPFPVTDVKP